MRIAHNHARRLLADLYGYEESERLFDTQDGLLALDGLPVAKLIALGATLTFLMFFRPREK